MRPAHEPDHSREAAIVPPLPALPRLGLVGAVTIGLASFAVGPDAHAGPLSVSKQENMLKYAQIALHGPLPSGGHTHAGRVILEEPFPA